MADLNSFLGRHAKLKWQAGVVDCTLFASDWVIEVCGKDPAEGVRGTYSTLDEGNAIFQGRYGPCDFAQKKMSAVGWVWKHEGAVDGDVGLCLVSSAVDGKPRHVPAIHQGGLWLFRTICGIKGVEVKPESMWTPA